MNEHGITRDNLLRVFPRAIEEDTSIYTLGDAAARLLEIRAEETDIPRIFPEIDRLPEAVLDILAYDLKVDWYDYDYPLQAKREIIRGSVLAHKRLGTVFAVKSVLNSLYPDSEIEEWFTYDGRAGCFRININVTHSAETGAVEVYSQEEIVRRLKTVKRLSAHLESVSYMVRNAIVIGHQIASWQYRVPECNTLRCGTWWTRHTLGWSEYHRLDISAAPEPFGIAPELTGTLPDIKTPGWSVRETLRTAGRTNAHPVTPEFAGTDLTGTEWTRKTLGWSEQAGNLAAAGRADAYSAAPEFAGTLPEDAKMGYTLVCGAVRAGGKVVAFPDSPPEAGAPERAGERPERVTAGWSVRSGTFRAGAGTESFAAAPELAGTLPQSAAEGYTIKGMLRGKPDAAGTIIKPEMTGTLPQEAQHGERED